MAVNPAESWRVREVAIEALGDNFAQVSGQWLEGARVAQHLQKADRAWVFAAPSEESVGEIIASLPSAPGKHIIGIAPGRQPGWDEKDRACLVSLLEGGAAQSAQVGLLLSVDLPVCRCPHRAEHGGECPPECTECSGTNTNGCALYSCNGKP